MQEIASSQRLPPLNALRAFEAAGRLESIRGAAAELEVTAGAVSRQVRLLESWLGVALFRRTTHSVVLTGAGESYLAGVGHHLSGIAAATERIAATEVAGPLRVRTWTLFAGWLIPRLSDFRHRHPGIDLELVASSQRTDFRQADVDVEVVGIDTWSDDSSGSPVASGLLGDPAYDAARAIRSDLVCVCSPDYRETRRLHTPADLHRIGDGELLHSLTSPDLWQRWLRAAGVDGLDSRHGRVFGDSALTAAAARAGQGVALLPMTVLEDDLREGRLTVAIPTGYVRCAFDIYLIAPRDRFRRRSVRSFRDWLGEQVA